MMKIIVFGPTGGTGREFVAQALARGHQVTAFTRSREGVPLRTGITIVAGQTLEALMY